MATTPGVDRSDVSSLQTQFRGELIQPGDAAYEATRHVYNGMIDRYPALIAQCTDTADVIAAVTFARQHNLLVSIRGGGHNAGGLGVCDQGLVIDLTPMRYTHVDQEAATVRVGGGSRWGDVDHATHAYGLAVPSGFISTTGVAGLTLGGGIGHLTRAYGLTIDNLLEANVVLADGHSVTANARQHTDLFWGLRGGGGNFGVVTSFLFQAHPVHTVYAGPLFWELDQAPQVMRWYQQVILQAPDNLNGFFAFLTIPPAPPFPESLHNKKMCGVVWCYTGPLEQAEATFKPLRSFLTPALDFVGLLPYPALQTLFDALYPSGLQWYWKTDFINELSDEAIHLHVQHASELPTMHSTAHFYPINGAAKRIGRQETAWSYRDANWAMVIVGVDPDPAKKDLITNWAKAYWDDVHPFSVGGAYINFLMPESQERIKASYRDNYPRLAAIKRMYDPTNFYRVNQNIEPAP